MNSRVIELARQSDIPLSDDRVDPIFVYPNEVAKFAELIVRECIAKCNDLESMKYIADHFDIRIQGLNNE